MLLAKVISSAVIGIDAYLVEVEVDIKQKIGARIKELRNLKGMTQEGLSELIYINPKYLSGIERGKENPTINTIIKLSEVLDV